MSTLPQIKIGTKLYPVQQLMDIDLYATRKVAVYRLPDSGSDLLWKIQSGARIGKIYSWIIRGESLWWALYENDFKAYVKHEPNIFSVSDLKAQGVLDVVTIIKEKEKEKELQDMTIFDRIWNEIKPLANFAKIAIPIGLTAYVGLKIWGEYKRSESNNKKLLEK